MSASIRQATMRVSSCSLERFLDHVTATRAFYDQPSVATTTPVTVRRCLVVAGPTDMLVAVVTVSIELGLFVGNPDSVPVREHPTQPTRGREENKCDSGQHEQPGTRRPVRV